MDVNSGNVFSAVSLSDLMAQSLSSDADPAIRSPYDAIALLSHACMLAVGFRLIGLGEEHKIGRISTVEVSLFEFETSLQSS